MNDLPSNIQGAELCLYAKDTSVLVRGLREQHEVEKTDKSLSDTENWLTANMLKLNSQNTQRVFFITRRKADESDILVDKSTKWRQNIESVTNRLVCTISLLEG